MLPSSATPKTTRLSLRAVPLRLRLRFMQIAALVAITAVHPGFLAAQQPTDDDEVVRVSTDLLVFPIRVKDRRGMAAGLLTERDLTIRDDEHATEGFYLYQGADRVALVFALDQSGSLRETVSQQSEAALALFGRFGERSKVAVLHFAERPTLAAPFGRNPDALRDAFKFSVKANQHTAIFDAAAEAVAAFKLLPRVRSERRIVILMSDGLDNASALKAGQVIQAAMQDHVSFYVIHLPLFEPRDGRLAVRTPAKGFRDLAEKTGGKYFLVGSPSVALSPQRHNASTDLTPIFQAIEDDLRSQYLLGFYASKASRDGRKHRFKVSMPKGVEYQLWNNSYNRTHEFYVNMPNDEQGVAK
jgi:Ca-activated chloride channel homolog